MEIVLDTEAYSTQKGLTITWEKSFEIKTEIKDNVMIISANQAGLISLAKLLLTLAQDETPIGSHFHLDEHNSLNEKSLELIIEKNNK